MTSQCYSYQYQGKRRNYISEYADVFCFIHIHGMGGIGGTDGDDDGGKIAESSGH